MHAHRNANRPRNHLLKSADYSGLPTEPIFADVIRANMSRKDFENWVKNLHLTCERVLIEHGKEIMYREMITTRLADAAIDLYAMIATISRVNTRIEEIGAEKADKEIKICNTFCQQAWRRARRSLLTIDKNNDENMKEIADFISEEKQFPYETE